MNLTRRRTLAALGGGLIAAAGPALGQSSPPLRIEITEGVIEPMPFAVAEFLSGAGGAPASDAAARITRVIAADLSGTGLFREVSPAAHRGLVTSFDAPIAAASWRALGVKALVTGAVDAEPGGRLAVRFRLHDIDTGREVGEGLRFRAGADLWRRLAHKVADAVYSRITGEGGYFDSQVVFVAQQGPKNDRRKRLALMDYDGANLRYLTPAALVMSPRFSPTGDRVLVTSFERGFPRIVLLDLATGQRRVLDEQPGTMTFAPRFGPDGQTVVFSLEQGGNSEVFRLDLRTGQRTRLTSHPGIDTAPCFSPDGSRIVFESDRSGRQQLYIMPATGGDPQRISRGEGRYATPVWSPRGDLIAFTKQNAGRFHIGVMRTDGSGERLLTASFLDEGPTWAPNGRVIMFTRETAGAGGAPALFSVDISGRNLRQVPTETFASDPAWSPLLP
jgi:TolB protein